MFALTVCVEILCLGSNVSLGSPWPREAASKKSGWKDHIHLARQSRWSQMFGFVTPLSSIKSGLGFAGQTGEVGCAELPFPALSALEEICAQGCKLLGVSTAGCSSPRAVQRMSWNPRGSWKENG